MGYYCKNLYKCFKENIYLYFSILIHFASDALKLGVHEGKFTLSMSLMCFLFWSCLVWVSNCV